MSDRVGVIENFKVLRGFIWSSKNPKGTQQEGEHNKKQYKTKNTHRTIREQATGGNTAETNTDNETGENGTKPKAHRTRDIRQEITNIEIEIKTHMLDTNRRQDTVRRQIRRNRMEIQKK